MSLAIRYFFDARKSRKKEWVAEDNYFVKAEGTFTVQYPKESIPVPDIGRYQLHNEIDDCIVCDKCAKVCPVDCIDIEGIRATEVFDHTSDGTPKRVYAAKFDIDMAKCCFCGLCTVVCPTECLTMTKEADFSTANILDHNFSFSKMSDLEIAEKKREFEEFQAAKAEPKAKPEAGLDTDLQKTLPSVKPLPKIASKIGGKPAIKPKVQAASKPTFAKSDAAENGPKRPILKPKLGAAKTNPVERKDTEGVDSGAPAKSPSKPSFKRKTAKSSEKDVEIASGKQQPGALPAKPKFKKLQASKRDQSLEEDKVETAAKTVKTQNAPRPTLKPKTKEVSKAENKASKPLQTAEKPRLQRAADEPEKAEETPKKQVARPIIKPKISRKK